MSKRGQLNKKVQEVAKEFLGEYLTTMELRLIPYIQYVMVNEQRLKPELISGKERTILAKWRDRGYIEGGASGMRISEDFWHFMCKILLYAYVDYENQEEI